MGAYPNLKGVVATMPPLRDYWREINRRAKKADAERRARRKATDSKRPKCRCEAYPWPHRPGGGLCRFPEPPTERWKRKTDPPRRPYRQRYAGLRRQLARANGLHPIRDRQRIDELMPQVLPLAKQLKLQASRAKYRNMRITQSGIRFEWQSAGPLM